MEAQNPQWIHYLPIATTILSCLFAPVLLRRYRSKPKHLHLLWWGLGVVAYGAGTALESWITLAGNSVLATKLWYIAGALLGGYPLAQGTVFLLLKRRTAWRLTALTLPFLAVAAVLVALSPANLAALEAHRPSGAVLGWSWVRLMTPFINLYAAFFLIGGAALSAWRFAKGRTAAHRQRVVGNTFIAFGGLLPGIGGSMAKAGVVEALYVGELVGLMLIWIGFVFCTKPASEESTPQPSLATATS